MRNVTIKKLLAGVLALLLLLTAAGCGGAEKTAAPESDGSLRKVLDAGELIIGFDGAYPPLTYLDETGTAVGFDVDLAESVCARLGVKLVKKAIDWDQKETLLNSGEIDCIWSGLSVTPERKETMCLSEPYIKNELIYVVMGDSEVKRERDFAGRTIGTQAGSSTVEVLEAADFYKDVKVIAYKDNAILLQKLIEGEVDVAFVDSLAAYAFIRESDEKFYVFPDCVREEECAIGFRKDDQTLRDKVQETLSVMKGDDTLGSISTRWFGSDITIVK